MKKLLSNKKVMSGVVASLVGVSVLLTGLTLAWFTDGGRADIGTATLGKFGVKLTAAEVPLDIFNQPGVEFRNELATIQNTEDIFAIAKISLDATVDGDVSSNLVSLWQKDGAVEVYEGVLEKRNALPLGMWMSASGGFYNWGYDADGNVYVELGGKDVLDFAYTLKALGTMDNTYQGKEVKVELVMEATQGTFDEAIKQELGIDRKDIKWYLDEPFEDKFDEGLCVLAEGLRWFLLPEKTRSFSAASSFDPVQRLAEVIESLPVESGVRADYVRLLERVQ